MRILVLGAGGMMGHMAMRFLGERYEVFGTLRGNDAHHPVTAFVPEERLILGVDMGDRESVRRSVQQVEPDFVLNCVGIVKQLAESRDAIASIRTNSLLPHLLSQLCREHGAALIHLSTDCVFSGRKGYYSLGDLPDPVDLYGRSKLLGELSESEGLTLRTSIVGRQITGDTSLFEWVLANRGRQVRGFRRAIYSGVTTQELARIIDQILQTTPTLAGVWQVASTPINKYDLVQELNTRLDLGMTILPEDDFRIDRSLDGSSFVERTGIATRSWDAMLDEFVADQVAYTAGAFS